MAVKGKRKTKYHRVGVRPVYSMEMKQLILRTKHLDNANRHPSGAGKITDPELFKSPVEDSSYAQAVIGVNLKGRVNVNRLMGEREESTARDHVEVGTRILTETFSPNNAPSRSVNAIDVGHYELSEDVPVYELSDHHSKMMVHSKETFMASFERDGLTKKE